MAKTVLGVTRTTGLAAALLQGSSNRIRVVNYHATPPRHRERLRSHFEFFRERYAPIGYDDLLRFFETGHLEGDRPGLAITFDDGLRTNYDVAAPLLEEFGFPGWFFPPTDFVTCAPREQRTFAERALIDADVGADAGERIAMTESELRDLVSRGHVIGCHTRTHVRLGANLGEDELDREIAGARATLEGLLGTAVDVFCWVGGEEASYSSAAARHIRDAGFRLSFMTNTKPVRPSTSPLHIQRSHVDAAWTVDWVEFQLCGLLDVLYTAKRRRVIRATT